MGNQYPCFCFFGDTFKNFLRTHTQKQFINNIYIHLTKFHQTVSRMVLPLYTLSAPVYVSPHPHYLTLPILLPVSLLSRDFTICFHMNPS